MGSNETASSSTPLTGQQRTDIYDAASKALGSNSAINQQVNSLSQYDSPRYTATKDAPTAQYQGAGPAQTLNGGDYQALQDSLINSRLAVLDRQKGNDNKNLDEQMSARGIYNSGLALRAKNDLSERYVPQEQSAISDAVNQRYNLQANEQAGLNSYGLAKSNQANTFNLQNYAAQQQNNQANATAQNTWNADQTQKQYDAKWRPMDYLQGLWNGTGGSVSSSTGGGWSI